MLEVINKTDDKLIITVTENQIIINKNTETRELSTLEPGEVFTKGGVEYIVLGHGYRLINPLLSAEIINVTEVLRKDALKKMPFGHNNNWAESDVRKYLNNEYVREVEDSFGVGNIFHHTVNLQSLDGLNDYNTTTDKISLLTIDRYREYRSVIGPNLLSWWWLSTPDSTPSGDGSRCVRCVCSGGRVGCGGCDGGLGVRPFFILKSDVCVA